MWMSCGTAADDDVVQHSRSLSPKSEQPKTGREKGGGVEERLPLLLLLLLGWLEEQDEG